MANFNTHFTVAAGASAIVSSTLLSMEILAPQEAISAFFLGTLGGLLPDVDSAHSTSIKVGFNVLSFLATIMLIFLKVHSYSLVEIFIMSIIVFTTIRYLFLGIFRKISKHRGMFHSIPVAIIWGILIASFVHVSFGLNSLVSWIYGLVITIGYIVHLTLDELYSVDLENARMKKSFGTAFKFFNFKTTFSTIQTLLIYASIPLLLQIAPDSSLFIHTIFSHESWLTFKEIIIPYDGKWFLH